MPVPTITSVDPAEGPTMGGNLVFLTGTNYLLPVPVSPPGGVTLPLSPSIQLTIGGLEVAWANLIPAATTRLGFVAPKRTLALGADTAVVDITVTNLDSAGDPIPGETVTATDAYTYRRPDLSHQNQGELVLFIRALLGRLRSDIIPNVAHSSHPDFDSAPTSAYIDPATLPALLVLGPSTENDGLYEQNRACLAPDLPQVGEVFEQRGGRSLALTFDIVAITDKSVISLNMLSVFVTWVERNKCITYTGNDGPVTLDIDFVTGSDPQVLRSSSEDMDDGIYKWSAQLLVRGFQEVGLAGQQLDQGVGITAPIDENGVVLQPPLQLTDNSVGSRAPVSPSE